MKSSEKTEIVWNIINSILAGGLVFLGAASGEIADHGLNADAIDELKVGFMIGILTSLIIAVSKFKDFWDEEKKEYSSHLFKFI